MNEINVGISQHLMDFSQITHWVVASIVGIAAATAAIITAWKAIQEVAANRKVRQAELDWRREDYQWRRVSLVRELIERLEDNTSAQAAFRMVDMTETDIPTRGNETLHVTEIEIANALNAGHGPFDTKDLAIRDCFDSMLETFEHWEHYIHIDLVKFTDIEYPVRYYVKQLKHYEAAKKYMNEFGYDLAAAFVKRF